MAEYADWTEQYVAALPKCSKILAQIKEKWRENSFNALIAWLNTGSKERLDYMTFCDFVLNRLEVNHD